MKSLTLSGITDITLSEGRSGEGSITFGAPHDLASVAAAVRQWPGAAQYLPPSFDLIANARSVYDMLRRAQRQSMERLDR